MVVLVEDELSLPCSVVANGAACHSVECGIPVESRAQAGVDIGSKISSGLTQTCAKRCYCAVAKVTLAECGERVELARVSDPPDACANGR